MTYKLNKISQGLPDVIDLFNLDEKVLWEGNNRIVILRRIRRRVVKRLIILTLILYLWIISELYIISLIYVNSSDLSYIIIRLGIVLGIPISIPIGVYLTYSQYRTLEDNTSLYTITSKRIIERCYKVKNHILSKYSLVNSVEIKENMIIVDLKAVMKIELKRFFRKWAIFFFLDPLDDDHPVITIENLDNFKVIERLLVDIIPNKRELLNKGVVYIRNKFTTFST